MSCIGVGIGSRIDGGIDFNFWIRSASRTMPMSSDACLYSVKALGLEILVCCLLDMI